MEITKIDNFRIWFNTQGDRQMNNQIGAVKTNNRFTTWVPITLNKVNELIGDFGFETTEMLELQEKLEHEAFMEDMPALESMDSKLRDYQNEVVDRIWAKGSLGLFMEQRTGKTPVAAVASMIDNKIIISVPNGLQKSWQGAIKFFSDRESIIIKGSPIKRALLYKEFAKADKMILIGSIDTLGIDATAKRIGSEYDRLILDEAHFLRNNTKRTKGTLALRKLAKTALALTGTPSANKAEDVIPILMFLNPGAYTKWGLIEYFFNAHKGRFAMEIEGIKYNKLDEWAQLLQRHAVSIKQEDVMFWLPERTDIDVVLEMESKQRTAFKRMLNDFKVEDSKGTISRAENVLTQMLRLGQLGLDPSILGVDAKSAKTKWIKEWIKEHPNEPVVIWSTSKKYIDILQKELEKFKPLTLYGETKVRNRQVIVDSFNDGGSNIILANIRVASTGYTINRATTMIFMDRDWSRIENDQANARFVPTDHNAPKAARTIIDVMIEDSMDQLVREANLRKFSQIEIVNSFMKLIKGER